MPPTYANGHISATGDLIHFMFVLEWGFEDGGSNGAISGSNKFKMAAAAILKKFQMAISPQQLTIYLYSAHRAVIFAIAQLSCSLFLSTRVQKLSEPNSCLSGVIITRPITGLLLLFESRC